VAAGDDVDVLEIDGASNRGIDEIRQLRQNVAVRPSRVRYKIYIIDEVHMLTKEAFNALLKTLEEPPEHVKFIFATTEPQKIPVTILSRCQRFDFAGIPSSAIEARLGQIASAEGVEIEPAALQILAGRAAGSMRDSQSLLEQLVAQGVERITASDVNNLLGIAPAERLSGLVRRLVERDAAGALAELDAALQGGVEVGLLLDQLVGYFRDAMAAAVGCPADLMLYALPSQAQEVSQVARQLGLSTILAMGQILDQTAARMRLSMHGRTLVELAIVRVCQLGELDELATLIAELRPTSNESGAARHVPPASAPAKKNVDSPAAGGPLSGQSFVRQASCLEATKSSDLRRDPSHPAANTANLHDNAASPPPAAESVLAQWQQAVADGGAAPVDVPPRTSRRAQLAELAERPFVRRALELFDLPAGQLRYTPPDGDASQEVN
jgi:DNA polymerase-3 subunit gamma/tau